MLQFFKEKAFRSKLLKLVNHNDTESLKQLLVHHKNKPWAENLLPGLMHDICYLENKSQSLQVLLECGGQKWIDSPEQGGSCLLHTAVMSGDLATVKVLLAHGANPNIRDLDGVTPMILCKSMNGIPEISELLLTAGANPLLVNKSGKNYLM